VALGELYDPAGPRLTGGPGGLFPPRPPDHRKEEIDAARSLSGALSIRAASGRDQFAHGGDICTRHAPLSFHSTAE